MCSPNFWLEQFDQAPAVARLFLAHALEHRRRCGIVLPQALGKVGIDALIFFFQRNGQSQNFAFRQLVKLLHGELAYLYACVGDKCEKDSANC